MASSALGSTPRKYALDDWATGIYQIYRIPNSQRRSFDMWLGVLEAASEVAEAVRKPDYAEALGALADTFAWIAAFQIRCTLENPPFRIDESLADVIALKYPGICGHCLKNYCDCGLHRIRLELKKDKLGNYAVLYAKRLDFNYKRKTVDDWMILFKEMYGNSIYATNVDNLCFHWFEELGETARALRKLVELSGVELGVMNAAQELWKKDPNVVKKAADNFVQHLTTDKRGEIRHLPLEYQVFTRQLELRFELADSFSWLCSLALKLEWVLRGISGKVDNGSMFLDSLVGAYCGPQGGFRCRHGDCGGAESCTRRYYLPGPGT